MPDTAAYYHAAYVVASTLYAGYVISLWWRARRARGLPPREADPLPGQPTRT